MRELIQKIIGRWGGSRFSALNQAPPLLRQAQIVTKQTDVPAHLDFKRDHRDLPKYDRVISAAHKDKQIPLILPIDTQESVCVLLEGMHSAHILISVNLWGTDSGRRLIKSIRDQLAETNFKISVIWASSALVEDVAKTRHIANRSDSEAEKKKWLNDDNRKYFFGILSDAVAQDATDVHIELKEDHALVRFTIDQELWPWNNGTGGIISKSLGEALIKFAFYFDGDEGSNSAAVFSNMMPISWTITHRLQDYYDVRLRIESIPKIREHGSDLIYRILRFGASAKTYKLIDMYSPDQYAEIREALLTTSAGGVFIIAGIPNSGKTTSIKAAIEEVPDRERKKFVVNEDPSEYVLDFASHASIQASLNDPERPAKYAEMFGAWLRGNPHVMSGGEVRDNASALSAFGAAEVGTMAFFTVHAASIMLIFNRLTSPRIAMDLHTITSPDMIKILVYQKLIPTLCVECKLPFDEGSAEDRAWLTKETAGLNVDVSKVHWRNSKADCSCCSGRGVKGMTLVAEVYRPSEEFLFHISRNEFLEAKKIWNSLSDGRLDTPNMAGKDIFAHAFYKMLIGQVDPRTVRQFGQFSKLHANAVNQKPNLLKVK